MSKSPKHVPIDQLPLPVQGVALDAWKRSQGVRLHVVVVLFLYTCWAVFQVVGGIVNSQRATDKAVVGKDQIKLWCDAFAHFIQVEVIPVCCVHAAAGSAALHLSPQTGHATANCCRLPVVVMALLKPQGPAARPPLCAPRNCHHHQLHCLRPLRNVPDVLQGGACEWT